jgi:uncharacterized membrane protein YbhN (UPF0104 family)
MAKTVRKTLVLIAKFAVAGVLLWVVLSKVHWEDYTREVDGRQVACPGFKTTVTSADRLLLAGSFVGFTIPIFILGARWWYLLRTLNIRVSVPETVRLTYLGLFFNYVIPGTVSGDLVKAYYMAKHSGRKAAVLVSVFTDRILGLLQFAVLPAAVMAGMLAADASALERLWMPAIVVGGVLLGTGASLALMLSRSLRRRLGVGGLLARLPTIGRHLTVADQAAELYRRRPSALLAALAMTFVGQMCFIVAIMLAGMSLGLAVPWYHYCLYIPLIYIIAAVPVSPGGLGVAEAFYVAFFVHSGAGVSEVQALALALVARLIPMICSLPGLVVMLRGPSLPDREQMQAELAAAAD